MRIAFAAAVLSAPAVLAFVPVSGVQRGSLVKPLNAGVNINENVERDIGSMDEWANNCGVQRADGFQLTTEDGNDWSVIATQPIEGGSPVLFVPSDMILSSDRVRQELEELGPSVEAAVGYLGRIGGGDQIPQFYLFLKILVEYDRGDQSPYFPWLNSLPRLFYSAVSMTEFCYECLPPLVFSLARGEKVKCDNFVDALKKIDSSVLSPATKSDREVAKWAFNVVNTRAWGPDDGDKQIVPMADMFNHGTETEITINYDDDGNCYAYASGDVPAGSPLRMSYGCPKNPSTFFAKYGFLDQSSPASFCKIMIGNPSEELKNLGYDTSKMLFYKDTGEISEEVWDVTLYQNLMSNKELQQQFYDAHLRGDGETKGAIHQQYMLETATTLQNHVDTFLKTLDELAEKGVDKDLNEHPRLPLIQSHNEFVQTTFLQVKARLDPMVAELSGEYAM